MPEKAAPFHEPALDIAGAERFVRHSVTSRWTGDQFADDFRRTGAVMSGHSHFQVARMIGATINPLAENTEPASERRIFSGKTRTRPYVRQIEHELVDRISFIFERSSDGQAFAGLEEGKKSAAPSRRSIFNDKTKLSPRVGRRVRDDRGEIVLQFGASATNHRDGFAFWRFEQRAAARIND